MNSPFRSLAILVLFTLVSSLGASFPRCSELSLLYIVGFLYYPLKDKNINFLIVAFFIGLVLDNLYSTSGIHSKLGIGIAVWRQLVLQYAFPGAKVKEGQLLSFRLMSGFHYFILVLIPLFIHHLWVLKSSYMQASTGTIFILSLMKYVGSTLLALILVEIVFIKIPRSKPTTLLGKRFS